MKTRVRKHGFAHRAEQQRLLYKVHAHDRGQRVGALQLHRHLVAREAHLLLLLQGCLRRRRCSKVFKPRRSGAVWTAGVGAAGLACSWLHILCSHRQAASRARSPESSPSSRTVCQRRVPVRQARGAADVVSHPGTAPVCGSANRAPLASLDCSIVAAAMHRGLQPGALQLRICRRVQKKAAPLLPAAIRFVAAAAPPTCVLKRHVIPIKRGAAAC